MKLDPWPFVTAAYAIVAIAAVAMSLLSWRAMRRAERALEESRRA
ncbi:hypothetical protein [Hephaestia mangrovi]|nr:hypothetical protein [Hephaestia mangrovi]